MRKKCYILTLWSFLIALAIYAFTYFLYHYLGSGGVFLPVCQDMPAKPFVTLLFGILGVCFHFAGVMCLPIGRIFFAKAK